MALRVYIQSHSPEGNKDLMRPIIAYGTAQSDTAGDRTGNEFMMSTTALGVSVSITRLWFNYIELHDATFSQPQSGSQ